nr:hypothetical protein [Tanacetum cinerariifolium]
LTITLNRLKRSIQIKGSTQDGPNFDSVFEIKKLKASIQGKDNAIRKLRTKNFQLQETRSNVDRTLDFKALYFQITRLTEKVLVLQEQNKLFRVENVKVKQHYKKLYDSIKITHAKHIDQTTTLLTENENLKVQINAKLKCFTIDSVTPKVLAPGMYAIDVKPIPPRLRNNREVHLDYLKHLKESVATHHEIVEEAKVERPLERSVTSACLYTKHSQELLEYVIDTFPKDFNKRDKKPNGKLIHNSIINGPDVRRMIPEPGDTNREVLVNETFHVQTDDELTEKELKQIEANDQAIQTILLGISEDIYAAVNSCETAQEIWLRVQQMMKGSDIGIQEKKAKLFNEWEMFTSTKEESIESYYHRFLKLMNDLKRKKHFPEKITSNLKFLNNLQPEWSRHVTIGHQTKDLHTTDYTQLYDFLKYNQKERISSNPRNRQIAQPEMNMGQDRQMQMVRGNANQNLNGNGHLVAACAEGNVVGNNGNQIRCYNCRGVGHFARNYLDEIKEVNANCILMANLQQASTLGTKIPFMTQTDQLRRDTVTCSRESSKDETIEQRNKTSKLYKEAKFAGDFKSLTKEADESHAKHKALELEIERLLRAVVKHFENCIIKKENEYAKLWNDWYKKCEKCKFDKISYDKAYNDMQRKIKRLQAQLGDLKGKSKDTSCVSDTLNPLSQKLENENVELEFQVLNYAKENAHLKTIYKNLFDSISVSRTQTKTIISSLQNQLHNSIYENAKLRAQLFNKVSDQKDNKRGTSANTKFVKQSIM